MYTNTFMFVIPLRLQISEKCAYNFNTAKKPQKTKELKEPLESEEAISNLSAIFVSGVFGSGWFPV